jgi:hypothetical protein
MSAAAVMEQPLELPVEQQQQQQEQPLPRGARAGLLALPRAAMR